jgi:hypothetical protein
MALILNGFSREEPVGHLAGWRRTSSKSMCRQAFTAQNRPQRHRRFYLAIKLDRLAEPMAGHVAGPSRLTLRAPGSAGLRP